MNSLSIYSISYKDFFLKGFFLSPIALDKIKNICISIKYFKHIKFIYGMALFSLSCCVYPIDIIELIIGGKHPFFFFFANWIYQYMKYYQVPEGCGFSWSGREIYPWGSLVVHWKARTSWWGQGGWGCYKKQNQLYHHNQYTNFWWS